MKYGIIGAMDEEIERLQEKMTSKKYVEKANVQFIEGYIHANKVVVLKSGIGKVNAAMATTILMEQYQPTHVINTGSAGGFLEELSVGDVVIGNEVVYHDVDVTAFQYEYGQVPKLPSRFQADPFLVERAKRAIEHGSIRAEIGLIATGDTFMDNPNRIQTVRGIFPEMLAAEMEGAAIAQVCYQYQIPFVIVRALSDIAGKKSPVTFNEFLKTAAENAANMIIHMISDQ